MTTDVPEPTDRFSTDALAVTSPVALPADCRYALVRFLAEGGLGQVFVGLDRELGREVAIKFVRPDAASPAAVARFQREAEITGRLEHPGVVPVYGLLALPAGGFCYAMRLLTGQTLATAILDYHDLPPAAKPARLRKLLRHFIDACNTVAFAHSRGILHRDIKPANVILGDFGETWLLDWGLAKEVPSTEYRVPSTQTGGSTGRGDSGDVSAIPDSGLGTGYSTLTAVGSAIGTPGYMSPEQAKGDGDSVGPTSDVYALGVTLGVLLTGKRPGRGDETAVPRPLRAVVRKAMTEDPADRYPTAAAVAADVEAWLADEPVTAEPEPARERLRRWAKRNRATVVGLVALLLAAVPLAAALAVVSDRGRRQAEADAGRIAAEKQVAEGQRAEAEKQRTDADRSAADARDAVEKYLTAVSDNPALGEPRLKPLRRELLTAALGFYQRLAAEQRQRPGDRPELTRTLERLAFLYQELGEWTEAITVAEQGRTLTAELAAGPAGTEYAARLTGFDYLLSALYTAVDRPADATAALARTAAAPYYPTVSAAQRKVVEGMTALNVAVTPDALRNLAEAIAEIEQVVRAAPADAKSRNFLAFGLAKLGATTADPDEAARRIEAGLAHHRRLVRDAPTATKYRDAYQQALGMLGETYRRGKRYDDAIRCLTEAVEYYEERLRDDPENGLIRSLAVRNWYQVGAVHFDAGRPAAAAATLPRVEAHTDYLVKQDPRNAAYTTAALRVCTDQVSVGRFADALAGYERLASALGSELARSPTNAGLKQRLATAHLGAAGALLFLNRPVEALAALDRGEALNPTSRGDLKVLRHIAAAQTGRHADAAAGLAADRPTDRTLMRMAAWGYAEAFAAAGSDPVRHRYADAAADLIRHSLLGPASPGPLTLKLPAVVALAAARADVRDLIAEVERAGGRGPTRERGPVPRAGR